MIYINNSVNNKLNGYVNFLTNNHQYTFEDAETRRWGLNIK